MANGSISHKRPKVWRVLFGLGCTVILLALVLLVLFAFSNVTGEELSPDDFSRRSFQYRQIPWTNRVISKIRYRDRDNWLAQYLIDQKWLQPSTNPADRRWDLVRDNRTSRLSRDCDARFLDPYLDSDRFDGQSKWIKWSSANPELAPVLWGGVAKLARNNVYWAIPPLMMETAKTKDVEPADFRFFVTDYLATQFLNEGIDRMIAGENQLAVEAFSLSIGEKPSGDAYNCRSKAYDELGNSKASESDRKSALKFDKG